eukprot:4634635-Prymnesium_polylepis.1
MGTRAGPWLRLSLLSCASFICMTAQRSYESVGGVRGVPGGELLLHPLNDVFVGGLRQLGVLHTLAVAIKLQEPACIARGREANLHTGDVK